MFYLYYFPSWSNNVEVLFPSRASDCKYIFQLKKLGNMPGTGFSEFLVWRYRTGSMFSSWGNSTDWIFLFSFDASPNMKYVSQLGKQLRLGFSIFF